RLAQIGDAAIEPLLQVLRDHGSSKWARIHALWTLNEMLDLGKTHAFAADWSRVVVEDPDADVRAQGARALGLRRAKEGIDSLLKALDDADASVRMHAAVALGRIGDAKAAPKLYAGLADTDPFARFTRIQALRAIDDWKSARQPLESGSTEVRMGTILALTGEYHPDAVAELAWAVEHAPDPEARAKALEALAEVHRKADP